MGDFDGPALIAALDRQRAEQGLGAGLRGRRDLVRSGCPYITKK